MSDVLLRGTYPDHSIRFAVCRSTALCGEGIVRHKSDWVSGWLLSEALVCAVLLSAELKDQEKYTLRWMYPGPVGAILADMTEHGEVRGFTQKVTLLPDVATLGEAIGGNGRISVVTSKPSQLLRTGITETVFQHLPRDLAYFLSLSFQVETALAVGLVLPPDPPVRVHSAIGVLLQPLPGCDPLDFERVRQSVEDPAFQEWLASGPRLPEEVLARIEIDEPAELIGELEPFYACRCSREKADNILRMIDPVELQEMLEADGQAEINCHFCADSYVFSAAELQQILRQSHAGNA
ncbi:MAG: Hsp33 family molecular chaperone HslO [SAR324 cluster bacterium]|nr:Hsp33 family molecular chaperone HslO [SAR324 cluster bacterium]